MISFGNAASSHSGLIPLKTACKKRAELLWAIASKKNCINLHSAAFVTVFGRNFYNIRAILCNSFCDVITRVRQLSIVSYTMSGDVHRFGSHCYGWHKPIISIFRIFLRKVIESSFWCKFISFASCARAYETWKQWRWIKRTLTYKHKIWGKHWLYLRSHLKAFPVFSVLETCREYLLTIDLEIVEFIKKNYLAVFWKMRNL